MGSRAGFLYRFRGVRKSEGGENRPSLVRPVEIRIKSITYDLFSAVVTVTRFWKTYKINELHRCGGVDVAPGGGCFELGCGSRFKNSYKFRRL